MKGLRPTAFFGLVRHHLMVEPVLRRVGIEPLVPRPAATLFVHMPDDAMQGMRIFHSDLLIADRSITPSHGCIVAARVLGEVLIRRLVIKGKMGWL